MDMYSQVNVGGRTSWVLVEETIIYMGLTYLVTVWFDLIIGVRGSHELLIILSTLQHNKQKN